MASLIKRVGTTYIPVANPSRSSVWYQEILGAVENYQDQDKVILDFADQSFFLVKAMEGERAGFTDYKGNKQYSMTFEVDGLATLRDLHAFFLERDVQVGEIEDRGHVGNNFVFSDPDGNVFDVWSELSPKYQ